MNFADVMRRMDYSKLV